MTASIFWDNQEVIMVGYLDEIRTINCILCRRTEAAVSGFCEEEEREVDSRRPALAR